MSVDSQGWLDWAEREPGPADKVYSQPNAAIGYVPHSMVGYLNGWYSRLFCTDMYWDSGRQIYRYTPYAAASVHGSVLYSGHVIQHYPLTASCWGAGSRYPNTHLVQFETEGGPPGDEHEPFTEGQLEAHLRIIRDISSWRGWRPRRPIDAADLDATLYEHRESTRWGSEPTACPSGRTLTLWETVLARRNEMPTAEEWKVVAALTHAIAYLQAGEVEKARDIIRFLAR